MSEPQKLHTAALVKPAGERRRQRKARKHAAAKIETNARRAEQTAERERVAAERAERRNTTYLPAAGEPGAAALRTPGRLRLPRHQDTSATLAGAYPFLAEGGLGADGVFIGQDLYSGGSFVYDPWTLYARGSHCRIHPVVYPVQQRRGLLQLSGRGESVGRTGGLIPGVVVRAHPVLEAVSYTQIPAHETYLVNSDCVFWL